MLCRWFFTVCSLMNIFSAISLFLNPWATRPTISRSRWLSGERSRARPFMVAAGRGRSSPPVANCCITAVVVSESSQISPACTLRMLLNKRSVGECFSTMPQVPSFMACTNSLLSSEPVRTMTLVAAVLDTWSFCRMVRPCVPGIFKSSNKMSGRCVSTAAKTSSP